MQLTILPTYNLTTIPVRKSPYNRNNYTNVYNTGKITFKGGNDTYDFKTHLEEKLNARTWLEKILGLGENRAEQETLRELLNFREKRCEVAEKAISSRAFALRLREGRITSRENDLNAREERILQKEQALVSREQVISDGEENLRTNKNAFKVRADEAVLTPYNWSKAKVSFC